MAHVTVVNDSPEFLELVHDILEGDQYDTTLIDADRDDVLEMIRQSRPDLLMIDLRMGGEGVNGWNTAQEIRANEFDGLPVLICSGDLLAIREIEADLAATHNVGTLTKPFEINELIESIDKLLAESILG